MTIAGDQLWVWIDGVESPVGDLFCQDGEYHFRYREAATDAVSLIMPLGQSYETMVLHPVFQQNLPEGFLRQYLENIIRKSAPRTLYANIAPDFELLSRTGRNQIGRLRFTLPEEDPVAPYSDSEDLGQLLDEAEGDGLIESCLSRFGMCSGVCGMQPKALIDDDTRLTLPMGRYLVKFAMRGFRGLAINEHFCLQASRHAGLETANTWLSEDGDRLVVERFDAPSDGGPCLGFEEACSLAGLPAHGKYNGDHLDLSRILLAPIRRDRRSRARADLFGAIVLSMTVENGDAHLKNFGVLYDAPADVRLAPVYDVLTTTAYLPSDLPALSIDGRKSWPDGSTLLSLGQRMGLSRGEALQVMGRIDTGVHLALEDLREYVASRPEHEDVLDNLSSRWNRGIGRLREGLTARQLASLVSASEESRPSTPAPDPLAPA